MKLKKKLKLFKNTNKIFSFLAFKVILNEICPWEFKSRRTNNEVELDYSDPKYYNNKD